MAKKKRERRRRRREGQEGRNSAGRTKENGVQPFIPSPSQRTHHASSIDRNRRGEFPMRGGSYLIHSPWVLATLHGDYFTGGQGGRRRGGGSNSPAPGL